MIIWTCAVTWVTFDRVLGEACGTLFFEMTLCGFFGTLVTKTVRHLNKGTGIPNYQLCKPSFHVIGLPSQNNTEILLGLHEIYSL